MRDAVITIIRRIRPNILLIGLMLTAIIIWDIQRDGSIQIASIAIGGLVALAGQILDKDRDPDPNPDPNPGANPGGNAVADAKRIAGRRHPRRNARRRPLP